MSFSTKIYKHLYYSDLDHELCDTVTKRPVNIVIFSNCDQYICSIDPRISCKIFNDFGIKSLF